VSGDIETSTLVGRLIVGSNCYLLALGWYKASLKGAALSHVNHLNFGGHNHIPGTADRLSLSGAVNLHKLLTVGGNVDHIYRRDLYSAAIGRGRAAQLC